MSRSWLTPRPRPRSPSRASQSWVCRPRSSAQSPRGPSPPWPRLCWPPPGRVIMWQLWPGHYNILCPQGFLFLWILGESEHPAQAWSEQGVLCGRIHAQRVSDPRVARDAITEYKHINKDYFIIVSHVFLLKGCVYSWPFKVGWHMTFKLVCKFFTRFKSSRMTL